jgi:hypothetical protein
VSKTIKNNFNRQDARNARFWEFNNLPFLATLAPWRFKIIYVHEQAGAFSR